MYFILIQKQLKEMNSSYLDPSSTSQPSISVDITINKHPLTSQRLNQNERTNNTSLFNARKMATTATLTAVSAAGTNNNSSSSSADNNKRKSEENIGPSTNRKPTHRRISNQLQTDTTKMKSSIEIDDNDGFNKTNTLSRTTPTFRIPKLGR
jgi:hypothetical protein